MKKTLSISIAVLFSAALYAQEFPGYRSGNYTGVNSVFFNPAAIADSRYFLDVNVLSVSTMAANDQASFRLKNISQTFNGDSIRSRLFGKNAGPASGMLNVDVHGPSAMLSIDSKSAIAVTTRTRMFANVQNVDGKLFNQLNSQIPNDPTLPYTLFSDQNMKFSMNAWSEIGVAYSRVLVNNGAHVLKGGLTLKYLAGTANGYVNIDRFNGTINSDEDLGKVYLENTTGRINTGFSGMRISGFEAKDLFTFSSSGFGTDMGLVYEYRPDGEMQTVDGFKLDNDYQNTYRFRFGLALLDLGSISHQKDMARSGSYNMDITGTETLGLDVLSRRDVDDYRQFFDDNPELFNAAPENAESEYTVSLPTTLQADADLLLYDGWYLNLAGQFSLSNNKTKLYNNRNYTNITLTPRYESALFGFYLPVNYNKLTKLNAGLAFRFGPLFFGSGSFLTALMGDSRQADFYFGLRFGELR